MRVHLAVFDMVGTTVRAGDEVPSAFRTALASVGVELSDEAIAKVRGRSKREAIAGLLAQHPMGPENGASLVEIVYGRFQESLRGAYRARAQAMPGVEGVFRFLDLARVKVVLTTGLDRPTAELLFLSLGWDPQRFSGLVTGDDVSHGRPAPDLIHAAMRLTGIEDPRVVVVIGDTTSDLDAAAAAGVGWSLGVLTGAHTRAELEAHPHSAILESVEEVPPWLSEAGAL
jgi:phosphonatase-like hydrolase